MSAQPAGSMPKIKETRSPEQIAREQAEERKENIIAIAIALLLIAGIVVWIWVARSTGASEPQGERVPLILSGSASEGSEDAPVVVVEFSDFECPYCAVFAQQSLAQIRTDLIETGKVRMVYKNFPLSQIHPQAQRAAQAAACAQQQDAFWAYHDALYEHQDALEINQLLAYAKGIVADEERFRQCLVNDETYPQIIREKQQGIDAGVTGTPTFFFNGRRVTGTLSAEQFAAEVDKELAQP